MTIEQQARNLLERLGVQNAQTLTSCDVCELADLIHCLYRIRTLAYRSPDIYREANDTIKRLIR